MSNYIKTLTAEPTSTAKSQAELPDVSTEEMIQLRPDSNVTVPYSTLFSSALKWESQSLESQVNCLAQQLATTKTQYQREIAEKVRLSQRLESLLHILPAGVVVIDAQGIVVECNQTAVDLLGEPLLGEVWRNIITRCFAPRDDDGHEISLKDGRRVNIATRSLESEPGQIILLNDLTETRRLQQALSHHQRLSALGKMVASLAHQIRTPLSAAMLYAGHLMKGSLPPVQQIKFAEKLMARLSHLDRQVRDMLVFARGELPMANQLSVIAFFTSLQHAVEGVAVFQRAKIEWQCPANKDKPNQETIYQQAILQCNQDALVGACLNLMTNAVEAANQQAVWLRVTARVTRSRLLITIKDNGPGMSQAQIKQAKEPFFTTKAQGTGLGIAVVQAVVRAHQGDFHLHSIPDQGTCAQISIPLSNQPIATNVAEKIVNI
ncbi:sensor histidine kinase [Spartinivicinus poritis]|uniref:histidine kinase n=1 Tax=Spartinivicinus poritis TaxID=2994640 RepID=A0ABT5UAX6_9GAMM|nr:ATP-binding protein [Spartinivicinus sp. A2-2]MDE1463536.1 ATP-binding protein [Spartinivicinus sp. A2-2]